MPIARMRLRRNQHCHHRPLACLHMFRNVENSAHEGPACRPHLRAIHPHRRRVIDPLKIQPYVFALVRGRNIDRRAIPIRLRHQVVGNNLRPVVLPIQRLRIYVVIHQRGQHCAGNRRRIPARGIVGSARNLSAGLRHLGRILQLPAGVQGNWRGRCGRRQRPCRKKRK